MVIQNKSNSRFDFQICNEQLIKSKSSQLTLFIILAIIIVAGIVIFFVVRGGISVENIPTDIRPVYEYYSSCISENLQGAINLAETQGGYIYTPQLIPGNEKYPSSNQLDFNGFAVPYWNYISSSGIRKNQIPTQSEIEKQISFYLESEIPGCDFSDYRDKGFIIERGEVSVSTNIKDNTVEVSVSESISVDYNENSALKKSHKVSVNSKLGKFYSIAKSVYNKQDSEKYLENYGTDTLRSYAPVDGVEITCAPKIWNANNVASELLQATEANTAFLRLKSNNFGLNNEDNKYFIINQNADENVRFMYSSNFPTKIEIWPAENGILMAEAVGQQEGLGILGFCYVPYHFVYDFTYPVLVQIYDENEMFQFPIVVNIEKNQATPGTSPSEEEQEVPLCDYKNSEIEVYTFNTKLEPVEANISFKCFSTECNIGETKISGSDAVLTGKFPECVNGFVIAETKGYAIQSQMISTNEENTVNVMLEKEYELELNLKNVGDNRAVISFESAKSSTTVVYPEQNTVSLREGDYNITAYVYKNASIVFPATKEKKCVKVSKTGIAGYLGGTEEQCFDVNIPEQTISMALSGGGKQNKYFVESELEDGKILSIDIPSLKIPSSLEDLQNNYIQFEENKLGVIVV